MKPTFTASEMGRAVATLALLDPADFKDDAVKALILKAKSVCEVKNGESISPDFRIVRG